MLALPWKSANHTRSTAISLELSCKHKKSVLTDSKESECEREAAEEHTQGDGLAESCKATWESLSSDRRHYRRVRTKRGR